MCGITGIINFNKKIHTLHLQEATTIISHRGPDDAGYLLWDENSKSTVFAGVDTHSESQLAHSLQILPQKNDWNVGLGHRRLSIVDLSPAGHQPMLHRETGITITYNGEIYNYKELRTELENLGHHFLSHSDTEVLLKSWIHWGPECLNKLNGMFGFLILDPRQGGKLFAIRDRFGVKPLYWTKTENYFGFASEIKQLKTLPDYKQELNKNITYDYLAFGQLDHTEQTFDQNIFQLKGGQMMEVSLNNNSYKITDWYKLPQTRWHGTEKEAIEKFKELLTDSVRLRLRADVKVGSCLSGGLDSSAIVCLMDNILKGQENKGIETITACFEHKKYDEWEFAETVVNQTKAKAHKVFPSFKTLQSDLEKLLWHMDEPFGSTSQFSQWCVFKGASEVGLKVMLDGQGSDEQLAGYSGNELPHYAELFHNLKINRLIEEGVAYKQLHGNYPKSQLVGGLRRAWKGIDLLLPTTWKSVEKLNLPSWLVHNSKPLESNLREPKSLRESLIQQTLYSSLPALLKYEDRNSMAWSIESRVPFMDYRFVEFVLNLSEELIYRKGVQKYILREAMRNNFPKKIYERKDKMGFTTPEEVWIKGEGKDWFVSAIKESIDKTPELITSKATNQLDNLLNGKTKFDFSYWRLACLGNWLSINR